MLALILVEALAHAKSEPRSEVQQIADAIGWLGRFHKAPVTSKRAYKVAALFVKYAKRWKVDPWMAISIACQESKFRNRPRRIYIKRCKTEIENGAAVKRCWKVWPGERGMLQMVPRLARRSYRACTGWDLQDPRVLENTEINICTGMHLMAYRKNKIARKIKQGKRFNLRGGRFGGTTKIHGPCARRHVLFCSNGNRSLCQRFWWVASWNWGTHQVLCGRISRRFDFLGYPIRILKRYDIITRKFKTNGRRPGR